MSRVVVMGAGSWGTTIAKVIADAGNEVVLWSRREEVAVEINETKRNSDYLPGIDLPSRLTATSDLAFALQEAQSRTIVISFLLRNDIYVQYSIYREWNL